LDWDTDDVGRQLAGCDFPLIDGTEDDGDIGEDFGAVLQREIQRGGEAGDDQINFPARVLPPQVLDLKAPVASVAGLGDVEVLGVHFDPLGGVGGEGGADGPVGQGMPGAAVVVLGVQDDHQPAGRGAGGRGDRGQRQHGHQGEQPRRTSEGRLGDFTLAAGSHGTRSRIVPCNPVRATATMWARTRPATPVLTGAVRPREPNDSSK
jgi:hypothetical protein